MSAYDPITASSSDSGSPATALPELEVSSPPILDDASDSDLTDDEATEIYLGSPRMISLNFFPTQDGNGQQNGRVIARVCVENFIYRHNAATNHQQERRFKYSRLDLVTLDYQTGDVLNNAAEPVQITAAGFVSTGGNNLHLPAAQIFSINPVEDHTRDCRVASISTTGRGHCVCAVQYNDLHQPAIREAWGTERAQFQAQQDV